MEYQAITPSWEEEYTLVDFGEGWRWEIWGKISVQRPDTWAIGKPSFPRSRWEAAHTYHPSGSYEGQWDPPLPEKWPLKYPKVAHMQLWARRGRFKHLGFFPEQGAHWEWLYDWLKDRPGARVLNLFAYTGGASIAAALAGARVTHVDSSKSALTWAAENAQLNRIQTIRWIPEDARKFVRRAVQRRETYHAILIDPPAYGIGAEGQRWILEKDLPLLLSLLSSLLSPQEGLLLINVYSAGLSPLTLWRLVSETLSLPTPQLGELALRSSTGRLLSTGIYLRTTW
ncbi:MAG: class I SAM-dependent methyltransferase [Bacteroidia bacterium]|nr:class I SAM-dependent methyltransferase [Bacteroidia bacterium]